MNRNLIYFFLLILVAAGTYYFVFKEHEDSFDKSEANFTVKNIDEVKTIFLSNLNGSNLKFTKPGDEWVINDTVAIVQSLVKDLLEALQKQKAVQPVRLSIHDQVISEMSSNSTKVEVYTDKGKTHTFYVDQNAAPDNLTYMLTEGAKRPYVVKFPLNNLFLGIRYNTDIKNWRSKKIMNAKADEIEMIDVSYKDSTQYSFHLENKKGGTPTVTGNQTSTNPLNVKRVNSYLRLWDSLYCLGYEERNKIKDTILTNGKKLADITLQRSNKPIQKLTLYFKPISKGTKGILKIGNEQYDFDVLIGFLNERDMVVVTRNYAQIMLRTFKEFYEEDTPVKQ